MSWRPRFETRFKDGYALPTDSIRQQIVRDGFIVIRNFFDQDVIDDVRSACEQLSAKTISDLKAAGLVDDDFPDEPIETRLSKACSNCASSVPSLYREELHLPEMFDLFFGRDLLDLIMSLTMADELRLFPNYSMRPKLPSSSRHNVGWHQDAALDGCGDVNGLDEKTLIGSFGDDGHYFKAINCWTPLVPATKESGCMQFLPGSHRKGILKHARQGEIQGGGLLSSQVVPDALAALDTVPVDVVAHPRDLVLFSNLLVHRGQPNASENVRWSVDWRYQDTAQPTHRPLNGHVVRSMEDIDREVQTASEWSALSLQ